MFAPSRAAAIASHSLTMIDCPLLAGTDAGCPCFTFTQSRKADGATIAAAHAKRAEDKAAKEARKKAAEAKKAKEEREIAKRVSALEGGKGGGSGKSKKSSKKNDPLAGMDLGALGLDKKKKKKKKAK